MGRLAVIMLGVGAMLATAQLPANAIPLAATRLGNAIPKSAPMPLGRTVLAPIAAIRCCVDNDRGAEAEPAIIDTSLTAAAAEVVAEQLAP